MTPASIKSALIENTGWFGVVACHDFFCMTEQCCHVRFSVLEQISERPEKLLAWIIRRNARNYAEGWINKCNNVYVKSLSPSELQTLLLEEIDAIPRSEHTVTPWVFPFQIEQVANTNEIFTIDGIYPYDVGATYITCWWNTERFYYFETHIES